MLEQRRRERRTMKARIILIIGLFGILSMVIVVYLKIVENQNENDRELQADIFGYDRMDVPLQGPDYSDYPRHYERRHEPHSPLAGHRPQESACEFCSKIGCVCCLGGIWCYENTKAAAAKSATSKAAATSMKALAVKSSSTAGIISIDPTCCVSGTAALAATMYCCWYKQAEIAKLIEVIRNKCIGQKKECVDDYQEELEEHEITLMPINIEELKKKRKSNYGTKPSVVEMS